MQINEEWKSEKNSRKGGARDYSMSYECIQITQRVFWSSVKSANWYLEVYSV